MERERERERDQEVVNNINAYDPTMLSEWLSSLNESKVRVVLASMWRDCKGCNKGLKVATAPMKDRAVTTTATFAPGAISLVPFTLSIATRKVDDQLPNDALRLDIGFVNPNSGAKYSCVLLPNGGHRLKTTGDNIGFNALKPVADPFLVPYWFVQQSPDEKEANVHVKNMKSTDYNVTIPILVNKKEINAGTALVMYSPPKKIVKSEPAAKRRKLR